MGFKSLFLPHIAKGAERGPAKQCASTPQPLKLRYVGVMGEGNFGVVHRATTAAVREELAVKVVLKENLNATDLRRSRREAHVLQSLHHDNIVRYYEQWENKQEIAVVQEMVGGGSLLDRIRPKKPMNLGRVAAIMHQLLSALAYLDEQHVVHRDIKCENLLFKSKGSDVGLKIIDFGMSNSCAEGPLSSPCGTPEYVAPEILVKGNTYGPKVDVWSAGVVAYVMVTGHLPFVGGSVKEVLRNVLEREFQKPELLEGVPGVVADFIMELLSSDPEERPSARDCLKHPFFSLWGPDKVTSAALAARRIFGSRELRG